MAFAVHYLDRTDAGDIRQQHREAHIAYRKGLGDKLLLAGPLLSEDSKPVGSLVLLEAGSLSEAKNIAHSDPYVVAGLFDQVLVHGYKIMVTNLAPSRT
jgi:uncharacterized protein YciI